MSTDSYTMMSRLRVIEACDRWLEHREKVITKWKKFYVDVAMGEFWNRILKRTREQVEYNLASDVWSDYTFAGCMYGTEAYEVGVVHAMCIASVEEFVELSSKHAFILSKFFNGIEKAECTSSDSWNCKYCNKTTSCEALKDPRNFGGALGTDE